MFRAFSERRPWAAVLIAVFLGPLAAMLYLNRGRLSLIYLAAGIVIAGVSICFLPALISSPAPNLILWLIGFPLSVVGAVQAYIVARRWPQNQALHWYAHWYSIAGVILLFPAIAFGIRTFVYQPFDIRSASMSPSLNQGDYFVASKFAYSSQEPQRGDVIVFHARNLGVDYVKRIVGLPSERIQMKNGVLLINGIPARQQRVADFLRPCYEVFQCRVARFEEFLPNGRTDFVLDRLSNGPLDNTDVFVVPPDAYFVLGDNRDNSDDSRSNVGYVPRSEIVGRAAYKYIVSGHWAWRKID